MVTLALNGEGAGVPVGGDETEKSPERVVAGLWTVGDRGSIENFDSVERRIGNEQSVAIGGLGQSNGISPRESLVPCLGGEQTKG